MNIDVSTTTFRLADADVTCQHVSAEHHGCQDEPRRTRIIFVFGTRYPEIVADLRYSLATKFSDTRLRKSGEALADASRRRR